MAKLLIAVVFLLTPSLFSCVSKQSLIYDGPNGVEENYENNDLKKLIHLSDDSFLQINRFYYSSSDDCFYLDGEAKRINSDSTTPRLFIENCGYCANIDLGNVNIYKKGYVGDLKYAFSLNEKLRNLECVEIHAWFDYGLPKKENTPEFIEDEDGFECFSQYYAGRWFCKL